MLGNTERGFPLRLLNPVAYLTIAAVGVAGIANLPTSENRSVALGLFIVFGILFRVTIARALAGCARHHLDDL